MSYLGQLAECMRSWRNINKALKDIEKVTPKEYGEYLQKKHHRGKCQNKKRRGKK